MDLMQWKRLEITFQADNAHTDVHKEEGERGKQVDNGGYGWFSVVLFAPHAVSCRFESVWHDWIMLVCVKAFWVKVLEKMKMQQKSLDANWQLVWSL